MTVAFLDLFTLLPIVSPIAAGLGGSAFVMGVAVGIYSFTNMFGNMFGGMGIDKVGAKRILMAGMFFTSINLMLYTFVSSPEQLLLVRLIHGMGSGLLAPSAFALMAQFAREGKYGITMAHTGAIVGVSAIFGPAFAGIVSSKLGYDYVFYSVSALMIISFFLVLVFVPTLERKKKDRNLDGKPAFKEVLKSKLLTNAYLGSFSLFFTLGVVTVLLPIRAAEISTNGALGGMMISTFGIVAIIIFLLPTNRMYDYFNPQKIQILGMMIVALSQALLSIFMTPVQIFIAMGIFGLGFALMFPSMTTTIMHVVDEVHRGKAFGIFYACFSLGVVVGSFVVGIIKATPSLGFITGSGIVLLMSLIVYYRFRLSEKETVSL